MIKSALGIIAMLKLDSRKNGNKIYNNIAKDELSRSIWECGELLADKLKKQGQELGISIKMM